MMSRLVTLAVLLVIGCSSSPAANDAAPTPGNDTGPVIQIDAASPGVDAAPDEDTGIGGNALVGTWQYTTTASGTAMQTLTSQYTFTAGGTFTMHKTNVYPDGTGAMLQGCTSTTDTSGTYTLSGTTVTIAPSAGSASTTGCTDTSNNVDSHAFASGDAALAAPTVTFDGATTLTIDSNTYSKQ